ncbi:hypothetical protein AWC15_20250 [Mycobacterium lacus]|uniref:Uncharacterized protein n=1 Tax=Mycobacterium lacus TaxID=169765 RepID=A0A1X1Y8C7_9MYCO|nr:hypothetical protein [Mycobacterium lacus]ORW07270.1 hypothetical protein AWC15_20250 [Mycobacterium lacus]BBX98681.1 hypothetical protein MLAC_39750 [Mycobacterium lacus]
MLVATRQPLLVDPGAHRGPLRTETPDRLEIPRPVGDIEPKRQLTVPEPRGLIGQRMGAARGSGDAVATLERGDGELAPE